MNDSGGSGESGAPTDKSYVSIHSNDFAFAALNADGNISDLGTLV